MAETILTTLTIDGTRYTIGRDVGLLGNDLLIVHIDSRRIAFVKTKDTPHKWKFVEMDEPYSLPPTVIAHLMMWMT